MTTRTRRTTRRPRRPRRRDADNITAVDPTRTASHRRTGASDPSHPGLVLSTTRPRPTRPPRMLSSRAGGLVAGPTMGRAMGTSMFVREQVTAAMGDAVFLGRPTA